MTEPQRLCSRCRRAPAAPSQRWCKDCRADSARRHRDAGAVHRIKAAVPEVVVPRPERTTPPGATWPLTPVGACATCLREAPEITLDPTPAGVPLCRDCRAAVWPSGAPVPRAFSVDRGTGTGNAGNGGSP